MPPGFEKPRAQPDIAVIGDAADDPDFMAGRDRVRYSVTLTDPVGSLTIDAALRFQPIGFRWADNLRGYDAWETKRFVSCYTSMSAASSDVLARATTTTRKGLYP